MTAASDPVPQASVPAPEPCFYCGFVDGRSHVCIGLLSAKLEASDRACGLELAAAERCAGERDRAIAQRDSHAAEIARLVGLVHRYGWHRPGCPADKVADNPCDCGFDKALDSAGG